MSLNFCDLLVVGSDLSGVMAATLLAKRGMNVLILDDDREGDPFSSLVTGLGSKSFKSLLGKLMIPDTKLQALRENKVGCQVIFPRHRLDLHKSRPLFLKEIEREFPQEKEKVEALFAEIDVLRQNFLDDLLGFFPILDAKEKKRFIRWFQTLPREKVLNLWNELSDTVKCLLKAELRFFSRGLLMDPPLFQMMLFLPPESESSFSVRGGVKEVKRLFFDKLDYFGGMVHPLGEESLKFVTKGREIRAVQMARYHFPTRCRFILNNTGMQSFFKQLPLPWFSFLPFVGKSRIKKKMTALTPAQKWVSAQYQVSQDILPTPMKENLIAIQDPSQPLEGDNYLEINLNHLSKNISNELDTLLTVQYPLPSQSDSDPLSQVDSKIRRLLPFANGHLRRILPADSSVKENQTGELFAEEPEKILTASWHTPSLFSPSLDSPYKNLYSLGPNMLEWMGMEGKILAALRAVELIWTSELKVRNS